MSALVIDEADRQLLARLVTIRKQKERKSRRKLVELEAVCADIRQDIANVTEERKAVLMAIRQQSLPEDSLTPSEFDDFKLVLARRYQKERALAQSIQEHKEKLSEVEQAIVRLNFDIQKLIKDQEKLKVVIDEQ
ncbi:hypothetical protein [Shewanella surugensis]|uniref:Uncharacterized protein n=1 Tax=Shewanella surugensis TaxID=212020 RepID=A0ABT0L8I5_9GAMM|nr:hypothetical protein [Shewanella surugensis]MCL1123685.1 hypothetical protein [Shewanella surugensis]